MAALLLFLSVSTSLRKSSRARSSSLASCARRCPSRYAVRSMVVVGKLDDASLAELLDRVDSHNTAASESPHARRSPSMRNAASTGRLPPLSREPGHPAVRLTPAAQKFAWTDPGRNHMRASTTEGARRPAKSSDPAGVWSPGGVSGTLSGPRGKLQTHGATGLTASLG